MAQHEENGLPERTPGPVPREERDRLRADFGQRVRTLLTLTGLSSREFAQLYPAFKDSTIRKYVLGANLPPWDFLRDLLTEVSRRTGDQHGEQRGQEVFDAYRDLLVRLGADVRGSDQNSLLLRLLDGERALNQLGDELAAVRDSERQLGQNLTRLQAAAAQDARAGEAVEQLREQGEALARQAADLNRRRADLVADLDRTRAHLQLLETAEAGGGDHHQLVPPVTAPPMPTLPPATARDRGRGRIALAAACALVLLGVGVAAGVWASQDDTSSAADSKPAASSTGPTPTPTLSPSPTPTPSPTPSVSAGGGSPSASPSPGSSPKPVFTPPTGPTTSLITMSSLTNEYSPYKSGARKVNLETYPKTLYSRCSETTWQLERKYSTFVARYGATDDTISNYAFQFVVKLDDKVIADYRSRPGQEVGVVDVDVSGGFRLTVMAGECTLGPEQGEAVWIDPVLTPAP